MSVEQLQTISMAGYIASGVFLVITVLLFFGLRIPRLIEDMTGVTARRAIEDIRRQNEGDGTSGTRTAGKRKARGHHTGRMSPSGRRSYTSGQMSGAMGAQRVESSGLTEALSGSPAEATTVLVQEGTGEATTVLQQTMLPGIPSSGVPLPGVPSSGVPWPEMTLAGISLPEQSMAGNTEELSQVQAVQEQTKASVVVQVDIGFSESQETVD